MVEWEKVAQDRELQKKLESLIVEGADYMTNFPQRFCDELNQLTGNGWTCEKYAEFCDKYWGTDGTISGMVFALFHDEQYPKRKIESIYGWKMSFSVGLSDESVIDSFASAKYERELKKQMIFLDVDVEKLIKAIRNEFSDWEEGNGARRNNLKFLQLHKRDTYAYEKEIRFFNGYENKLMNAVLINLDQNEKKRIKKLFRKYCNHVCVK